MPLQTFRYAVCGGSNVVFSFAMFIIVYHLIAKKQDIDILFYSFKPYSFALIIYGLTSFTMGFFLNKYVVFVDSNLRGRVQLFRYFLSFIFNFCLNYVLLKMFVEYFHIKPVLSQVIATVIIIAVSYITQRHFTFRTKVTV
ncbi:GtrA family protein [Ferruginibacter albus]|uniref:GtrA family protein n=1 Tax=Ferruginibacter albus TaxID=2875540 RepID=UPI001CC570DC|nr:GtrA family protein [Ferruginibacter albus]